VRRWINHRQILSRQREKGRPGAFQRQPPTSRRFIAVRRRKIRQVRHRTQHHQLLDRLVRGPVFTETDGIMLCKQKASAPA